MVKAFYLLCFLSVDARDLVYYCGCGFFCYSFVLSHSLRLDSGPERASLQEAPESLPWSKPHAGLFDLKKKKKKKKNCSYLNFDCQNLVFHFP